MKIGVLSDTHDDVVNFELALAAYRAEGIIQVIHCGDITSASTARSLEGFEVVYVDGNMDRGSPKSIERCAISVPTASSCPATKVNLRECPSGSLMETTRTNFVA